jgi:hypothetical protein
MDARRPVTPKEGDRYPLGPPKTVNTGMKELMKNLPQILSALPEIVKYLKYLPVIMLLAGIGFGVYYAVENKKDPYVCVNNHVFEQLRVDSDVYVFKGGTCVDAKDLK